MVSRVYTPLISPYQRPQNAGNGRTPSATEDPKSPLAAPQQGIQPDAGDLNRPSSGLKAVQTNQFQKIPLDAVIHDFKSTMNALGVDDSTRQEVGSYLRVVRLQGAKEQPEVPFIKHTLKTAANSLDQYIGKALGQPSQVVKEWVDALLQQDIDYHADLTAEDEPAPEAAKPATPPADNAFASKVAAQATAAEPTKTSAKAQIKTLIEDSKTLFKTGQHIEADAKLDEALTLLADKNKPDWEGKVWQLKGRFSDQTDQWEKAVHEFDQAAKKFEAANLPLKQAGALHSMASILEDRGQLEKAKGYYQQVAALDRQYGKPEEQWRSLNDLGSVSLRKGDHADAVQAFESAARIARTYSKDGSIAGDLLSNLGAAYRKSGDYPQAITSYQQSLKTARQAKDRQRYTDNLQQLAAVYVEANQPEQAMKALQRLQALGMA